MAFKLSKHPTFTAVVELSMTGPAGNLLRGAIKGVFKRLDRSEIKDFLERYNKLIADHAAVDDLLAEVLVGWAEMQDDDGSEMPFTRENLNRVLENIPVAGLAFMQSYFKHAAGGREGN
ncbi:MAG: hypothetical protein IPP91_11315 [Betaproteobacteria bacterium]|nr:hypothetical protein [Betaproteobacteria bacterium]